MNEIAWVNIGTVAAVGTAFMFLVKWILKQYENLVDANKEIAEGFKKVIEEELKSQKEAFHALKDKIN